MEPAKLIAVGPYRLPEDRYYDTETHLWVRIERPKRARCGFDPLGSESCGDIVAVSFEPVGAKVRKGEAFGQLEAAKFVGPLIAPISGTIAGHNPHVLANPGLLNSAPLASWLIEVESLSIENDVAGYLHDAERIRPWFEAEVRRFKEQGMVAE